MATYKSREEAVFEHAQFSGLRNNVPVNRFGLDDLAEAQNVDIDDSKELSRRYGFGPPVVSGDVKSLWSMGNTALAVRNETTLIQINPSFSYSVLRSDLTPGLEMSFSGVTNRVYYSNGVQTGVVQDGASRTWGIVPPSGQPVASVIGGVLRAGQYQYAVTFLRSDMQESGTVKAGVIELTAQGGIRLSDIAVSSDPDVTRKVVYFSKWDGDTLYRVGIFKNDETTFDYQMEASMQVPLMTQHLRPAPAGQIVANFNGRTLVADGHTLYYSEPYGMELFDMRKNYQFANAITMVAALENGAFVGTRDEVCWLGGKIPEKWDTVTRLSYGAIKGATAYCTRDMILDGQGSGLVAVFATTQGICIGDDGGNVANMTQDRFSYPVQDRGAALIRRHRGLVQGVFALQGSEQSANATS